MLPYGKASKIHPFRPGPKCTGGGDTLTKTNITKANKNLVPWDKLPLVKSGLLGPVTINTVNTIRQ